MRGRDWAAVLERTLLAAAVVVVTMFAPYGTAHAEKISNPIAEFTGLDKITGQIRTFDVLIDESGDTFLVDNASGSPILYDTFEHGTITVTGPVVWVPDASGAWHVSDNWSCHPSLPGPADAVA